MIDTNHQPHEAAVPLCRPMIDTNHEPHESAVPLCRPFAGAHAGRTPR